MTHTVLTDILIIFLIAVPASFLFHKIKLPPIIGLLATGILIGPTGLGLVGEFERINLLAEIGVALLVFSLGLEFSLKHFGETKLVSLAGGMLQILLTASITFTIFFFSTLNWQEAVFFGCSISLSSTAIVYYLLAQRRLVDSPHGRISIGMLIVQDLSAIPMIALLPLVAVQGASIGSMQVIFAFFKISAVLGIFFVGERYILPHILHHITLSRSKELFLITVLVIALGFSYFTSMLGLSSALGAFLAGLMIADTDFRFHAFSEIAPFRYCFNSLFFVSIGMLFDPSYLLINWWWIPIILFAIPVGKSLLTAMIIFFFRYPVGIAILAGLALAQVGEFSFVIATVAKQASVISDTAYNFTISAAFLTILITPVIMSLSPRIASFTEKMIPFHSKRCEKRSREIEADHLKGHVIICGFGPLGSSVGHILEQAGKEYLVLELNPATVQRIKNKNSARAVYLGDGANAEILYKSGVERASVLAITAPDYMNSMAIIKQARNMNKELKIITRAKYRNQVEDLYAAGADIVISEELEAGIEMGKYILMHMGISETTTDQYIETIRAFGSADFF